MTTTKDITNALRSAEAQRKKLRDRQQSIITQRKALERQGIVRGSIHQQEKRPGYFVWYLNVASVDCKGGKRERRYIGSRTESSPEVQEVKDQIKRAAKYDELGRELAAVEEAINDFNRRIRAAIEAAEYSARRW